MSTLVLSGSIRPMRRDLSIAGAISIRFNPYRVHGPGNVIAVLESRSGPTADFLEEPIFDWRVQTAPASAGSHGAAQVEVTHHFWLDETGSFFEGVTVEWATDGRSVIHEIGYRIAGVPAAVDRDRQGDSRSARSEFRFRRARRGGLRSVAPAMPGGSR